jgi:hypothetical protein
LLFNFIFIFSAANGEEGGSFNEFLKRSDTNRIQAARLFGLLLGEKQNSFLF